MRIPINYMNHILWWPGIYLNQWKSRERIASLQNKAVKKLVNHAYCNVPYYQRLFDSLDLKPGDVTSVRDLAKLPILTKDFVLANYPDSILATNRRRIGCSARMTSGSSGKKLEVVLDHKVADQYRLMQLRQLLDIGYRPWDKIVYVRYGPPVTKIALQKLNMFRRYYVPLEWPAEEQLSEIEKLQPQIINAYPSVLYLLAKSARIYDGTRIQPKFLLSNSELLRQNIRGYIEDTFQCKVYDDYSCLEFSAIGFECRMQRLHIAADNVIVEIIDEKGNAVPSGEKGRIIITALNNFAMPYIRYEIGDMGILSDEECSCGRTFPVLESILGRCDDFLIAPSGQIIDPQTVVFQIEGISEIREFRVIQGEDLKLTVQICPEKGTEFKSISKAIKNNLSRLFGNDLRIDVVEVPLIERGATGKQRSVVSYAS